MNETLYDIDFTRTLPPSLKNDKTMFALGGVITAELQETIRLSRLTIIYARIDELEEDVLDVLAYDMHVDWYDDTYPINVKRAIIKDSVKVHKRMATEYSLVTALGDIYPYSEVESWYEYGGTHHRIRVILDITDAQAPVDIAAIIRAIAFYKRLTVHLDEISYQFSARLEIHVFTDYWLFDTGMTDKTPSGTYPRRNMKGGVQSSVIVIGTAGDEFIYDSPPTGTKPRRSTIAGLNSTVINIDDVGEGYKYQPGRTGQYNAGTKPERNIIGRFEGGDIEIKSEKDIFGFHSPPTGTKPQRSTIAGINDITIEAEEIAEGFTYRHDRTGQHSAGEKPERNTILKQENKSVSPGVSAEAFLFAVDMTGKRNAGTEPQRSTEQQIESGGLAPAVTVESFPFRAKRCGTSRTKNVKG